MVLADWKDRQSIAALVQPEVVERGMLLQLLERDRSLHLAFEFNVDEQPPRTILRALGIVVVILWIELRGIRVGIAGNLHDADDARDLAARVVEKRLVADFHIVPDHVASLIIADAVPGFYLVSFEIVDAVVIGLGLHQPVSHKCSPEGIPRSAGSGF